MATPPIPSRIGRCVKTDPYIETILRKWGAKPTTLDLGYPKDCPCFKEYRPIGYREDATDLDREAVDDLGDFLTSNLSPIRITVLTVRYRHGVRCKRRASRLIGLSEAKYRKYFRECIQAIEIRFLNSPAQVVEYQSKIGYKQ